MEFIIGVLLLVAFAGLVVYAVKGGNLMMGMLVMATIWTGLALIGNALVSNPEFIETYADRVGMSVTDALSYVYQSGPEGWGGVIVNFLFGAWFGRVMMDTGIVSTIIRKTVELGGDKPIVISILLSLVTAGISTSMFGTGAVVCIGVIVLPILLSLGIPKVLAVVSVMLSVGGGLYLNPLIFKQYQAFHLDASGAPLYHYDAAYIRWGLIALAVEMLIVIVTTIIVGGRRRRVHSWAAQTARPADDANAPGIALITPFLPVLMLILLKLPVILSFLLAGLYALLVCGKLKSFGEAARIFNKTFHDGAVEMAPLLGFILCIPMFIKSSELCIPYFGALLGNIIPKSSLILCIAFAVLAPLALFRGPLTLAGCGAATLGILKSVGFTSPLLFPLTYAPTVTMGISCCITQSWVAWGINYTKSDTKDYLKLSIPMGWVFCAIMAMVTYYMFG